MDKPRRFSGTHITIMVVAISLAVVGAPVAVAASTGSFVNITDPVTPAYKARVTSKGSLAHAPRRRERLQREGRRPGAATRDRTGNRRRQGNSYASTTRSAFQQR